MGLITHSAVICGRCTSHFGKTYTDSCPICERAFLAVLREKMTVELLRRVMEEERARKGPMVMLEHYAATIKYLEGK